jgi:hypothetical protein
MNPPYVDEMRCFNEQTGVMLKKQDPTVPENDCAELSIFQDQYARDIFV